MIRQLFIENLALIDALSIDFGQGLNILTGETGAGKSIIIDAVNLILGERADRELIQSGKDMARVEGIFDTEDIEAVANLLDEYGITPEEDGTLILMREISLNGKNICRVNGRNVTLSILKEISRYLVDIHGQHEHQSLLSVDSHLKLLDRLGGEQLTALKVEVAEKYALWKSIQHEINDIIGIEKDIERRKDLLLYQIDEITKVNLKPEEDGELNKERSILQNAEKIMDVIYLLYDTLYSSSEGKGSVSDVIGKLLNKLGAISHLDNRFEDINSKLESVYYQLEDVIIDIRDYKDTFDYNPTRLDEVEKRLSVIEGIKRKYGKTIDEVLEYRVNLEKQHHDLENAQQRLDELNSKEKNIVSDLIKVCALLSDKRKATAKIFENQMIEQLSHLGMDKSHFEVFIDSPDDPLSDTDQVDTSMITRSGYDKVEFMISPNPGEPLRPLAKIVSGGEMSRIMLAFKTILAGIDEIPILIFDEIDVGISGRMAQVVAEKMGDISRSHQVICVTHLPQIAAMADQHYRIEKNFIDDHTRTSVNKLDRENRRQELARMIGGATVSQLSLDHALELIDSAFAYKS